MSGFDYEYTCPKIDAEIGAAKEIIEDHFDTAVEELSPMVGTKERDEWVKNATKELYSSLEGCFETVRETNDSMRGEAEKQIQAVKDELEDALDEVKEREGQIQQLEDQLAGMEVAR